MVKLMLKDQERIKAKNARSCNPHNNQSLRKYPEQPSHPSSMEQKLLSLLKQKYQDHLYEFSMLKQ